MHRAQGKQKTINQEEHNSLCSYTWILFFSRDTRHRKYYSLL